jgi:hypothetical protein
MTTEPVTVPGYQEIGKVFNLDGDEVTVAVNDNLVTTDKPLQLLRDQFVIFTRMLAEAGWEAAMNDQAMSGGDGGND